MSTSNLEKLTAEVTEQLTAIMRLEGVLSASQAELAGAEKSHLETLETWQTALATGDGDIREPKDIAKLTQQITMFRARVSGVRKKLAAMCESLAAPTREYELMLAERDKSLAANAYAEIDAAKARLRQLRSHAVAMEQILDLDASIVPPSERGERYLAADGRELTRSLVDDFELSSEEKAPRELLRKLDRIVGKGRTLRAELAGTQGPGTDDGLAVGLVLGREIEQRSKLQKSY